MTTHNKISEEDFINDVLRVFNETNNTTQENYLKYGKYSKAPMKRLFGSWNRMLNSLDIKINMQTNVSKEDVINDMNRLINEYGYVNSIIQRKYSAYSQATIDRLFGSWGELAKQINQKVDGKSITDEQIKQNLLDIYNEFNFMSIKLIDEFCIVSRPTVEARFGSVPSICETLSIPFDPFKQSTSKLFSFVMGIASTLIKEEPKYEYTFDWLINPNTNRHLKLDAYYPQLNLAIEVDGEQHYKDTSIFGSCDKQIERDNIKNELLKQHNINLIRITYKDSKDEIIYKIKSFLSNS